MADLKPAYLVHGDDDVKIDAWRKRVRARAKSDGPSTTLEVLDDGASAAAVAEATTALTLSVGRRYVLAEGVERWKDKDVAAVKEALADLPADTVLVLIGRGKVMRGKGPAADALVEREPQRALALAEDLRDRGEETMHILFALLRQLRQCRRAWAMLDAGSSPQEIQSALRVPTFVAKGIVAQAGRADGAHLERALDELAELDYEVRGAGKLDAGTALTLAIARAAA